MKHRLLVLSVVLIMSCMMGIVAESTPAWGQHYGSEGCKGYEGDHGSDCFVTTEDKCSAFENYLENYLFKNRDLCS
jgi:hypothetical protein